MRALPSLSEYLSCLWESEHAIQKKIKLIFWVLQEKVGFYKKNLWEKEASMAEPAQFLYSFILKDLTTAQPHHMDRIVLPLSTAEHDAHCPWKEKNKENNGNHKGRVVSG